MKYDPDIDTSLDPLLSVKLVVLLSWQLLRIGNVTDRNALTEFENCESMVPPNNSPVGRDVSEAICRCLVHLGSFEAARERVEKVRFGAT
jgi:hypothetical protein